VECVIFVGIPASGKTTFYKQRLQTSHAHVSKDELPPGGNRNRRHLELLDAALRSGRSVVIDNTHPSAADRAPLVAFARERGARVVAYYFESDPRQSLGRNALRAGRARVPAVAIFASAKRLQPPTAAEGFDAIYTVRIAADGGFDIEKQL
jgi:predicted kinase